MEMTRSQWSDKRLDDLKAIVDDGFREVRGQIHSLQQAMIIAVVAMCTMMVAGFGALITLFAIHF